MTLLQWEEFKRDNPFNLTRWQFIRCRKYFPDYERPKRDNIEQKPVIWKCLACGTKGTGSRNKTICRHGLRAHQKRKHRGKHTRYAIRRRKNND